MEDKLSIMSLCTISSTGQQDSFKNEDGSAIDAFESLPKPKPSLTKRKSLSKRLSHVSIFLGHRKYVVRSIKLRAFQPLKGGRELRTSESIGRECISWKRVLTITSN